MKNITEVSNEDTVNETLDEDTVKEVLNVLANAEPDRTDNELIFDAALAEEIQNIKETYRTPEYVSFGVNYHLIHQGIERSIRSAFHDEVREEHPGRSEADYYGLEMYSIWHARAEEALSSIMEELYGPMGCVDKARNALSIYKMSLTWEEERWKNILDDKHDQWYVPNSGDATDWACVAEAFVMNKFGIEFFDAMDNIRAGIG